MIKFNVRNHDAVAKKISKIPRGARAEATRDVAKVIIGNQATGLQHYPRPPAKSKYVRTYALRFGWHVSSWDDGTRIKIANEVPYAPYVQGNGTQAWMHKGRWLTVNKVIKDRATAINRAIKQAVARYLKSKGL